MPPILDADPAASSQEEGFTPEAPAQSTPDDSKNLSTPRFDFDVKVNLSKKDKEEIVKYLEANLPKMRPDPNEKEKILGFFAMYEMTPRVRNFPYENAPSIASTDAHDKQNEWLDQAELAFLLQRTTFTIDREETSLPEDAVTRIERTFQRRFFEPIFREDAREILFEASYLGVSIVGVREKYNLEKGREQVVIKNSQDLQDNAQNLTTKEQAQAAEMISKGDIFITEKDFLKFNNVGAGTRRIDQTKFWYPRNTKLQREWEVVSEQEFYTKSSMRVMALKGELDSDMVEDAVASRGALYDHALRKLSSRHPEEEKLPEAVRHCAELDSNWMEEIGTIKTHGEAYEDEFALYRVTLKYGVKSDTDPKGVIKSWIEVIYCPANSSIMSATFCQDGFPYHLVRYRPVPYKAFGPGIAHERYNANLLDTDAKCLFLACVEQEVGTPLLINKNSDLWPSDYRAYPGSTTACENPQTDAHFMQMPEKSRLAADGISMILGSSPGANRGAGYASGRREAILYEQQTNSRKARIHSIALDLDKIINSAWKILCRVARFNCNEETVLDYVMDTPPIDGKLYILANEMTPKLVWTSVVAATTLTPEARLSDAMQKREIFLEKDPAATNNPRLRIAWDDYIADIWGMDAALKLKLLPNMSDFQQYQRQLGAQGGQREQEPSTTLQSQSSSTPFKPQPKNPPQSPAAPTFMAGVPRPQGVK